MHKPMVQEKNGCKISSEVKRKRLRLLARVVKLANFFFGVFFVAYRTPALLLLYVASVLLRVEFR